MTSTIKGEKRPINRPCSACSDGDIKMKYHDHYPPFADEIQARDCDISKNDIQCTAKLYHGDGYLACRYVEGHIGPHKTSYTNDSEWEE